MKVNLPRSIPTHRPYGFSAVEVSAVATIIAILALILIPVLRNRVEEAKITAAMDDMAQIEKAQLMAFGYAGHYFRLQDLMRPEPLPTDSTDLQLLKIPPAFWNRQVTVAQVPNLLENWKGPYAAYHRTESVNDLIVLRPELWRGTAQAQLDGFTVTASGGGLGPLLAFDFDDEDWVDDTGGLLRAKYPVDPWGNPYLFFGSGFIWQPGFSAQIQPPGEINETNFSTAAVYSLGPDGAPGFAIDSTDAANYYREAGHLGAEGSDDISREF